MGRSTLISMVVSCAFAVLAGVCFLADSALANSPRSDDSGIHRYVNRDGVLVFSSAPQAVEKTETSSFAQRNPELYKRILGYISKHSRKHRIDARLIQAMIRVESNFNPNARSHKNAQGLMQLIPATAERFNVHNPYDMDQNIGGGVAYMAWLLEKFNNNVKLALAGYNAGENAVIRHGGIPPYRETQNYVKSVMRHYNILQGAPPRNDTGISSYMDGGVLVISNSR